MYNFLLDHPDTKVRTWDQLSYILEEKHSFATWFKDINDRWNLLNDVPEWLIDEPQLRDVWISEYQDQLISLRLATQEKIKKDQQARIDYDNALKLNEKQLTQFEETIFDKHPIVLIHKITPSALSEADLLKIYEKSSKEDRRSLRKKLVNGFRLDLLRRYECGELSLQDLKEIVK